MAQYVLARRSMDVDRKSRPTVAGGRQSCPAHSDLDSLSSKDDVLYERTEVGKFLMDDGNMERIEHAADVYTDKARELMNVRDKDTFDKELMIKVVNMRSQRVYGCLMLPVNLFFFCIFGTSVFLHEDIANVYAAETGLRTLLTKDVENVETIEDVWDWMSDTLLPTVFLQNDYKGNPYTDKAKWGRVLTYNQLTGPVYLQQVRSPKTKCKDVLTEGYEGNHGELTAMLGDMVCYPAAEQEDSETFGAYGSPFAIGTPSSDEYAGGTVTAQEREDWYRSSFKHYQGGRRLRVGRPEYSTQLPGASENAKHFSALMYQNTKKELVYEHLNYLKAREWLDAQTKELLIRGLFLNAEVGRPRLHQFELHLKFSRGGGIFSEVFFETIILEIWDNWKSWMADLTWLFILTFKTVTELLHLRHKWKISYREFFDNLTSMWAVIQWAQIALGVGYLLIQSHVMVNLRPKVIMRVNEVLDQQVLDVPAELNKCGTEFHEQVSDLTTWTGLIRAVTATYLLLVFFSFFTAFKYQPRLAVVAQTLQKCGSDCFHFLIVVLPTFFGFAISGMLIFGRRLEEFSTFSSSVATCFKIMMEGEFNWPLLAEEHFSTTALWVSSFMVMLVILMLNMVLAIVLDVYAGVRRRSGKSESIAETVSNILRQAYYRKDWLSAPRFQEMLKDMPEKWVREQEIVDHFSKTLNQQQLKVFEKQLKIVIQATRIQSDLEDAEGASDKKESMKMALAEKLVIDKVNEALKELSDGTGGAREEVSYDGWLGGIAKQMGAQNHRMLDLQWQLEKLRWQWEAMEQVHEKGMPDEREEPAPAAAKGSLAMTRGRGKHIL